MMDNIDVPGQPAPAEQKLVERKNMPSSRQRSQGQHFVIRDHERSVNTTERSETTTESSVTINSESSRELVIIDMPASNVPATNPHYRN